MRKDFFEHLLQEKEARPEGLPLRMLSCIKESPLREDFLTPEDVLNFEEILQHRFFRLLREAKELSPSPWVWELLQIRYDLLNLKNFLKEKLLGLPRTDGLLPFPSPYKDEVWETLWEGREAYLPEPPVLPSLEMYQLALKGLREHLEEISKNPGLLDLIMDGTFLSFIPQLIKRIFSPFIADYYLEYQKLVGILFLWRSGIKDIQKYIPEPLSRVETGKDWEKTLQELLPERIVRAIHELPLLKYEKAVEDTLMERLGPARFFVFGPERVFGYLKGLEVETLNLRLAIGGRLQGIPTEDINRRLRKGYV